MNWDNFFTKLENGKWYYKGDLNLRKTDLTELPNNLIIDGNLDLRGSKIKQLPADLTVKISLDLGDQIESIGENLSAGYLIISNNLITNLPRGMRIWGELKLIGRNISQLPNDLIVGRELVLIDTQIESLPPDLIVGGNIDLYGSKAITIPTNFTVGGSLVLSNSEIKKLPDNLTVGGSLFLDNTSIEQLPKNLIVGEGLLIDNTQISALPASLAVGGKLSLKGTKVIHSTHINRKAPYYYTWQNGKYISFSYLENAHFNEWNDVLAEVLEIDGNTFLLRELFSDREELFVLHDHGVWELISRSDKKHL